MKIPSPIVTLLIGALIAVFVTALSVQAHNAARAGAAAIPAAVLR